MISLQDRDQVLLNNQTCGKELPYVNDLKATYDDVFWGRNAVDVALY